MKNTMNQTLTLNLIECIYEKGFDHQNWNKVLEELCIGIDARSAGLFFINFKKRTFRVLGEYGLPDDFITTYQKLGELDATATVMAALPAGSVRPAIDHTISKIEHPDFYSQLLLPNNVGYISALNICNNDRYFVGLGVHRRMEQTQLNDDELRLLGKLYPHFRRVFEFSDILEQLKDKEDSLNSALSRIPIGVIVIDRELKISYHNELASTLIKKNLGLTIENNTLKISNPSDQRTLRTSIQQLLDNNTTIPSLQIKRTPQSTPLTMMLRSIETEEMSLPFYDAQPHQVILYLSHPELCSFASTDSLQDMYRLTPAEAQLVIALTNGLTLNDIADDKNTSVQTVRSQLKMVFNKMNVNSQTDLVRHVLTSAHNLVS